MRVATTFDILGPVMVGPSSSHTAGALRIAQMAASLCESPVTRVRFTLYNSFAHTYSGHGTDRALLAGILGMSTDDPDIQRSFDVARERGIVWEFAPSQGGEGLHPNTVDIEMLCADGTSTVVRGESVGGGSVRLTRVNGVSVDLTGRMPAIFVAHRDVPGMLALMTGELGAAGVNIAYMSSYRTTPGQAAYALFETDSAPSPEVIAGIEASPDVFGVSIVRVPRSSAIAGDATSELEFTSGEELLGLCDAHGVSIGEVMRRREGDLRGEEDSLRMMRRVLEVMREETTQTITAPQRSLGGMLRDQARSLDTWEGPVDALCGRALSHACALAMATLERSACMGVIVAAPTAGSSGVLPGSLLACGDAVGASDDDLMGALYCAAAIGAVIERNASVSGAEGGCQAEVGSASAMAAGALVQLLGGTPRMCLDAATIAISNLLGLVCDPIRGLVEVPCQTRNAIGVANAYTAAQMALAGISLPVPFDEAVDAMAKVGRDLPETLRETALGGLAAAPSACAGCAECAGCAG